jgi:hypothetical protein
VASGPGKENPDFRRYLSAHHDTGRIFRILANEASKQVDCTECANCCRFSQVTVTRQDLSAIAAYLDDNVATVSRLYTDPEPDAPALRALKSSRDGCVFLHRNLCLIYEARPTACREFPHIGESRSLGGRPASHDRWAELCPILGQAIERYKVITGYRR